MQADRIYIDDHADGTITLRLENDTDTATITQHKEQFLPIVATLATYVEDGETGIIIDACEEPGDVFIGIKGITPVGGTLNPVDAMQVAMKIAVIATRQG